MISEKIICIFKKLIKKVTNGARKGREEHVLDCMLVTFEVSHVDTSPLNAEAEANAANTRSQRTSNTNEKQKKNHTKMTREER